MQRYFLKRVIELTHRDIFKIELDIFKNFYVHVFKIIIIFFVFFFKWYFSFSCHQIKKGAWEILKLTFLGPEYIKNHVKNNIRGASTLRLYHYQTNREMYIMFFFNFPLGVSFYSLKLAIISQFCHLVRKAQWFVN